MANPKSAKSDAALESARRPSSFASLTTATGEDAREWHARDGYSIVFYHRGCTGSTMKVPPPPDLCKPRLRGSQHLPRWSEFWAAIRWQKLSPRGAGSGGPSRSAPFPLVPGPGSGLSGLTRSYHFRGENSIPGSRVPVSRSLADATLATYNPPNRIRYKQVAPHAYADVGAALIYIYIFIKLAADRSAPGKGTTGLLTSTARSFSKIASKSYLIWE